MVLYLLIIIVFLYSVLIISFYIGWKNLPQESDEFFESPFFVSVVIAARNEEKNIGLLLEDLKNQKFNSSNFEIIVINDHSTDNTIDILDKYCSGQIKVYHLPHKLFGKKAALEYGINHSEAELIVTVDADCRLCVNWLSSIVSCYMQRKPKLIVGPVLYHDSESIFGKVQSLEFSSLIASGAGAIGIGQPIMCNGANLAFPKKVYHAVKEEINRDVASGDDIFLLLAIKKRWKNDVVFLKSRNAVVYTFPETDFKSFLIQRKRWASKSRYYNDFSIYLVAGIVGACNFALFLLCFIGLLNINYLFIYIILLLFKSLIDFILLNSFLKYFGKARLMQYFWMAQFLYPFYMVFMIFYANLGSFRWKNRIYKQISI